MMFDGLQNVSIKHQNIYFKSYLSSLKVLLDKKNLQIKYDNNNKYICYYNS